MPFAESAPAPAPVSGPAGKRTTTGHRDRRGRGMRGPGFRAGPLAPHGVPAQLSRRERFDALALATMDDLQVRWPTELGTTELAVEEVPFLPDHWTAETVPLASYVPPTAQAPARVVLFRQPIERRAEARTELEGLVLMVLVEQVAEALGVPPEEVHPDYEDDD